MKSIQALGCIFLAFHFVLHKRKETSMWSWFHSGWIVILPLIMMVLCILMCVFMRSHVLGGGPRCCGHRRNECETEREGAPRSESPGSKG